MQKSPCYSLLPLILFFSVFRAAVLLPLLKFLGTGPNRTRRTTLSAVTPASLPACRPGSRSPRPQKMLSCALQGSIQPKHFLSVCQILSNVGRVFFKKKKNFFSTHSAVTLQMFQLHCDVLWCEAATPLGSGPQDPRVPSNGAFSWKQKAPHELWACEGFAPIFSAGFLQCMNSAKSFQARVLAKST